MKRKEQIQLLKGYREMLLSYKEMNQSNQNKLKKEQKEKQKVLVLTKKLNGKDVRVGFC